MAFFGFHPLVESWFASRFAAPTEPQERGWPAIAAGRHVLISAPTGSGKTLTAFLASIDRLLREALDGDLPDEIRVVYVSPLRALSNDIHRNLEEPLAEIVALAAAEGHDVPLRAGLRTGDTSSSARAALVRRPPHILVTTPESLYLMLTSTKGRRALRTVETVIVDEIHALLRDKRGSHLMLSLERLEALCGRPVQRIGLSATQKPIERVARFLLGSRVPDPADLVPEDPHAADAALRAAIDIVDVGHRRTLDLAIEIPPGELGAACTHEQWAEVHARLVALVQAHNSTLIFVNTRRLAERVTHELTGLLGDGVVGSHHGSLAADIRLDTERRLKQGGLKAVVATSSLELGIDVGAIDLVVQIGSPRSIAAFVQRIGRSGHALGLVPKGRLFALTRDELVECAALIRAVKAGRLDEVPVPVAPLDVLAQQIVAETIDRDWDLDGLFDLVRRADPYRRLARREFDRTLEYLSEGISRGGNRSRLYLHVDHVGRTVKARPGARLAATANGGAIPELGNYRVVLDGEQTVVGTLDEDFAVESQRGDVFLLGNNSWRILHVRGGDVVVADAHGAPPTIPFWRGEAPGRTIELSEEVSNLREELERRIVALDRSPPDPASLPFDEADAIDEPLDLEGFDRRLLPIARDLARETGCSLSAGAQVATYVAAQHAALGLVPTQRRVVFERFFDETGGMQLVVHAPFGAGIARAWAFAMRKRFCRSFDFELQATADDDGFILSLGPQHSFPIESLFPMLRTDNARNLLEQSVLYVPMFKVRWRWNVTRALLVLRRDGAKKIPPALQRFRADDLLTAVFPKLTGCQEEHTGDHEIPDHPLTNQTMHDCLHEALDLDGLLRVLGQIERGEIELVARDTREPSPFSYELLNANPYAFLDGGEIQERRARAVTTRRSLTVEGVRDLGRLDPEAIARVRAEARPLVRSADELHDLLLGRIALPVDEADDWRDWFADLVAAGRAGTIVRPDGIRAWVPTERWPAVAAAFPDVASDPPLVVPATVRQDWTAEEARLALARGLIETCGPIAASDLAARVGLGPSQAFAVLEALEGEGVVLRGSFTPHDAAVDEEADAALSDASATRADGASHAAAAREPEWCHRRLLARIHRLTLEGLREEIRPVSPETFFRFLVRHHGLTAESRRSGPNGLFEVVGQLQGLDVPAACWERDLLPLRLERYVPGWLDELCLTGEVGWGRLHPPRRDADRAKGSASLTKAVPVSLFLREDLPWLREADPLAAADLPEGRAREVLEVLLRRGALFASDLLEATRMLPTHLREALGELAARGLTTADGFSGLRHLLGERLDTEDERARRMRMGAARKRISPQGAGRWSAWLGSAATDPSSDAERVALPDPAEVRAAERARVEAWAWQLLRRWGVVFRDLWAREAGAPSWFDLLQVYRRLEARGEIRGGRFVTGVAGEQFALGETVRRLRAVRDPSRAEDRSEPQDGKRAGIAPRPVEVVVLSAADPLNLTGVLGSAPRVPALGTNRVAYVNGTAVAARQSGTVLFFARLTQEAQRRLERMLVQPLTDLPAPTEAEAPRDAGTGAERAAPADSADPASNTSGGTAHGQKSGRSEDAARRTRRPVAPRSSTIPRPPVR